MGIRSTLQQLAGFLLIVWMVGGCANEFTVFHSASGEPLLISRRAYTSHGCTDKLNEDAARMGVTLRYIHVRGTFEGRSLLWPLEQGYACEAAIGPEQPPTGTYPMGSRLMRHGS